jgi:hypothetical protein
MAERKTRETDASVEAFFDEIPDTTMREDCRIVGGCLYLRRLADVDRKVLEQLVKESVKRFRASA